ncbi:MAG: hypothetical protein RL653_1564 [Pseudomonadota bacterium]|jgi:hypothetical protein
MNFARLLLAVAVAASLSGCRDELAGPKNRRAPSAASSTGTPAPGAAAGATLGGGTLRYKGSRVMTGLGNARDGVQVIHQFEALKPPPAGYRFFVHLVDEASGEILQNVDHDFQGGALPLEQWKVGETVEDRHAFRIPPSPSGKVRLVLGFWNDAGRLPVDQPSAHRGDQRLLGPALELTRDELPVYKAPKAAAPPTVDGVLDDAAWEKAPVVQLKGSYDGRSVSLRTLARVTWDDQFVYVGFDCEDPDAWGTLSKRDDPIYNEEVVEVFLDANGDGKTYNELQVSPNNVQFDAAFVAYRSDLDAARAWQSSYTTAVKVRGTANDASDKDEGWSAELRIPISELMEVPQVPPRPGDRWRFNLYRLEHVGRRQVEGQAFSPLFKGDFHHLPRFGWLEFAP